ncbi:hypothetical protein PVAG01_08743 [Phlyctema vagabunda]|uniref:Uncharacterized protein n=1 Tax=Phlyctema vagabunda TaxID=108571 RepID=A0ABR4PA99_9HELO
MRARCRLAHMRIVQIPQSRMHLYPESAIQEEEASPGRSG